VTYTYAPFYDVEASVGNGNYLNSQLDVMLVQFLLFSIMYDSNWPLPPPLGGPDLPAHEHAIDAIFPEDGVVRWDLGEWISAFQTYANANGLGPLAVDGVVSHGGAAWGQVKPRAQNFWTIHALNHILFRSDPARFCALTTDAAVPPALQQSLTFMVNTDPAPFP
jgi:hypothetical protein